MKRNVLIIGVQKFTSSKGKPCMRIWFVDEDERTGQLDGLVGKTCGDVWEFEGGDYFQYGADDLVGKSAVIAVKGKETIIVSVEGVDD